MIFGGIIGLERSRKNRPAGFRTYMIVCLSSALVMMTNQFIYNNFGGSDPARLGAQVISGIGFLGAGTIIVTSRSQVRGLTSAAGLWASACLGLAIGIGFYSGAIIVALIVFIIITFFKKIDYLLTSNNKMINIYTSFKSIEQLDKFIIHCNKTGYKVRDIEITKDTLQNHVSVIAIITLETKERISHIEVIQKLNSFEELIHIEEL
ncbi:MAG TPA: MgtC/SapB family protein [Sedimentibacter sp.]|nr:MgtC/SapB family protein [Sedimentibacter sp.]